MKIKNVLYLLLLISFYNCSYNNEDDLTEAIIIEDYVNYEDNIKDIIDTNCISCHSNPPTNGAPMPLTTYDNVKDAVENRGLISRIESNEPGFGMPLNGSQLPQNSINLIILWVQEGLEEN